jgi:hypothetical protein
MDGLIGRLVANTAIDRTAAEKAGDIILDVPAEEGPPHQAQPFLAKRLGAEAQKAASEDASGMGGVMRAGLSIGDVESVTHRFIAYACGKVGEEGGKFVAAIPAQFV